MTSDSVVTIIATVFLALTMGASVALLRRKAPEQTPGEPRPAPVPATSKAETARDDSRHVRKLDYEADLAALQRRIADIETSSEQRYASVMGTLGNIRKAEAKELRPSKEELARQLFAQNGGAPAPEPAPAVPGIRVVRLPARGTG